MAEITIKRRSGRYVTFVKTFNSKVHMDNYLNILYDKENVIGVKII